MFASRNLPSKREIDMVLSMMKADVIDEYDAVGKLRTLGLTEQEAIEKVETLVVKRGFATEFLTTW